MAQHMVIFEQAISTKFLAFGSGTLVALAVRQRTEGGRVGRVVRLPVVRRG